MCLSNSTTKCCMTGTQRKVSKEKGLAWMGGNVQGLPIEKHVAKIYTWVMFENFQDFLYKACLMTFMRLKQECDL